MRPILVVIACATLAGCALEDGGYGGYGGGYGNPGYGNPGYGGSGYYREPAAVIVPNRGYYDRGPPRYERERYERAQPERYERGRPERERFERPRRQDSNVQQQRPSAPPPSRPPPQQRPSGGGGGGVPAPSGSDHPGPS